MSELLAEDPIEVKINMDEILTSSSTELFSDEATTDLSWLSTMTSTEQEVGSSPEITSSTTTPWNNACFFGEDRDFKRKCTYLGTYILGYAVCRIYDDASNKWTIL